MRRVNNWIANKLASFMATMFLFWFLTALDIAGAIVDPPANAQGWLLWGVSIFFQSVALPVLALVSNKQGERMERVLRETHDAVISELAEIKQMHHEQANANAKLARELADMQYEVGAIHSAIKLGALGQDKIKQALERMANPEVRL